MKTRIHIFGAARAAKSLIPSSKTAICAALLIAVGAALRLWAIGELPPGVNQDEASGLYDAWALLHYGIDRNGDSWPVHFVAWGSGLNALYPYMAMPFIWIGGMDIVAYRLPMAISGIVSLWLMWRAAHNAAGPKFALIALLFLALNPWHIITNRWALESSVTPFCVLLSAYFLSRHDRHRFGVQALAVAALSLSVYAYGSAYVFAPAFLAAALAWLALNGALTPRRAIALSAIAAAVAAPMMAFLIVNLFDLDTIRVLGATIPRYPATARYEDAALLFNLSWERLFNNLRHLADLTLASPDPLFPYNLEALGAPGYVTIIVAAGLGVVLHRAIARRDFGVHLLVAAWFVLALAVAAFASGVSARLLNSAWPLAIYLGAWGLASALRPRAALYAGAAAFIAISAMFISSYFREYEDRAAHNFNKGLDAAISSAIESAGENELIYISQRINQPYIHALYAADASPHRYLETRVTDYPNAHFQGILAFDRFVFLSPFERGGARREHLYQHLRTAGVNIDGIERYIFNLSEYDEIADAIDAERFIVERHGVFAHVYPKGGGIGGAGAIRLDAPLVQGEPAARAEFDLHLKDGELIYFKQPCDPYDTRKRFFLHIVPKNANDLMDEARRRGFDNLDFRFEEHGGLYGRQCLASVPLPEYGIAAIETGQTELTRDWPARFWRKSWKKLWQAELKF